MGTEQGGPVWSWARTRIWVKSASAFASFLSQYSLRLRITWGDLKTVKASRTPRSFLCEQSKWGWHWFLTLPWWFSWAVRPEDHSYKQTSLPSQLVYKAVLLQAFLVTALLWWHSHTASILEHFHHLKRKFQQPFIISYPPSPWQPLICCLLDISCKPNHIICDLLYLTSFI